MIRARFAPIALVLLALAGCDKSGDSAAPKAEEAIKPIAAPAGTSWTDKVAATPEGGIRMGNPDAPLKLVEYGSLSCPHCAKLSQEGFEKLTKDYVASGRLSYEFRSTVIHPQDVPLTLLVKCGAVEAVFPLIEQIYTNFDAMQAPLADQAVQQKANAALQGPADQRMTGLADALKYTEFFSARGLPIGKAHACLADAARVKQVADQTEKYTGNGVDSTPTMDLNGNRLHLQHSEWSELDAVLKQAGAR